MLHSHLRTLLSLTSLGIFTACGSSGTSSSTTTDSSVGADSVATTDSSHADSATTLAESSADSVAKDSVAVDSVATADTQGAADSVVADSGVDSPAADSPKTDSQTATDSAATDSQTATDSATADTGSTACGAGDTNLPAEPTIPAACSTLTANRTVTVGTPPAESNYDTTRIQNALNACASGQAVRLTANGASNAFLIGPITVPTGVTLWVDTGATLYGTRDLTVYNGAGQLIAVSGSNSGIMGSGVIDGQGGEPSVGSTQSPWDVNGGGGSSPALISVNGAKNFTLYQITLQNAPMFHVKLNAAGFVVWGVTIKTPSTTTNSVGTALSPLNAHNTDGIDPGEAASNGYIVCNHISTGDDDVAIKGATGVTNLTIAHNRFKAGHGMSIGSEINGGVSGINVYDLSVDALGMTESGGTSNAGIRIKSDPSRGGPVTNVTYSDVCVRDVQYPIEITPAYTTATGTLIPSYTGITFRNFYAISGTSKPIIEILGYDSAHMTGVTFDNVVIDQTPTNDMSYANITLGPGAVSFTPSGTSVNVTDNRSGTSTPNACANKWVTF